MKEKAHFLQLLISDKALRRQVEDLLSRMTSHPLLIMQDPLDREGGPDVVIIDVSGPNGSDRILASIPDRVGAIHIGTEPMHAVRAFDNGAVDCLLRPVRFDRLEKAVVRALQSIKERPRPIASTGADGSGERPKELNLRSGKKMVRVDPLWIHLVQSLGNYVKLYLQNGHLIVNETISFMEKVLPADRFVRIHRSYIIAIPSIASIGGGTIEWQGREIPIGGTYRKKALEIIQKDLLNGALRHHGQP